MERRVAVLETELKHMQSDIQDLTKMVTEMNDSLTRYRGVWGGILMAVMAMVAGVKLALSYFK